MPTHAPFHMLYLNYSFTCSLDRQATLIVTLTDRMLKFHACYTQTLTLTILEYTMKLAQTVHNTGRQQPTRKQVAILPKWRNCDSTTCLGQQCYILHKNDKQRNSYLIISLWLIIHCIFDYNWVTSAQNTEHASLFYCNSQAQLDPVLSYRTHSLKCAVTN